MDCEWKQLMVVVVVVVVVLIELTNYNEIIFSS
jgi:hypothetical protein